jgi:hypothetical protein
MINLRRFLQKKPDHPMADVREARKAIAELPVDDPFKSLEEISFWLQSLYDLESAKSADRIAVAKLLDETAQPFQRALSRDYLAATRMNKAQESRLWGVSFEYWRRLAAVYFVCIENIDRGARGAEQLTGKLPDLTIRALRALASQIKLLHLRYRPVDERTWSDVIKLYMLAEGKLFVRELVTATPFYQTPTSVQQEILKILMLEAAAPDRLAPAQIELAEGLVGQFASSFVMAEEPQDCTYYFDLSARKAPARLQPGTRTHSVMRFFGAGSALPKLEETLRQVKLSIVPQELDVDDPGRKDELLDLLSQLLQSWSATPPQRKYARKAVVSRLNVVNGFSEIRRRVAGTERIVPNSRIDNTDMLYQERLDLRLYGFVTEKTRQMMVDAATRAVEVKPEEDITESWVMENISESGFGAIIPELAQDWVKVGSLLALRPENGAEWRVGVVRRLSRTPQLKVYVGIQVLAHEPVSVRLRPIGAKHSVWENVANIQAQAFLTAVLLPQSVYCLEESCLLLEPGNYESNREYELIMRGEKSRVRLTTVFEQGEDFERTGFALVERRARKR